MTIDEAENSLLQAMHELYNLEELLKVMDLAATAQEDGTMDIELVALVEVARRQFSAIPQLLDPVSGYLRRQWVEKYSAEGATA